jgi:hypothetical protein
MHFHRHAETYDRIGVVLSMICLVHCLALPLLLAALPFLGFTFLNEEAHPHAFHLLFALLLLGVGGLAFGQGYRRHRRAMPVVLGTIGTILLFLGALNPGHWISHTQEHVVTIFASFVLLMAHWQNRRRNVCQLEHSHTALG